MAIWYNFISVLGSDFMNKVQQRQYEILVELDRICKKNNIEYFLDGGTLLGAVRHQGFIPWDDDLDVGMFRKDYNKFVKIINEELNDKYFFQNCENDIYFGYMFGKLRIKNTKYTEKICKKAKASDGIFIDVFPFDNISSNEKESKRNFMKVASLRIMLLLKNNYIVETNTLIKKMEKIILKVASLFISKKGIIKKINKIVNKYNDVDTGYVTNFSTPYFNKSRFNKQWLNERTLLNFENGKYMCPKNYDSYLKYIYNDYMTLPPIEKRVSHGIVDIEFEDGKKYVSGE